MMRIPRPNACSAALASMFRLVQMVVAVRSNARLELSMMTHRQSRLARPIARLVHPFHQALLGRATNSCAHLELQALRLRSLALRVVLATTRVTARQHAPSARPERLTMIQTHPRHACPARLVHTRMLV